MTGSRTVRAVTLAIAALAVAITAPAQMFQPPAVRLDTNNNLMTIDAQGAIVFGGSCVPGTTCKTTAYSFSAGTINWEGEIGSYSLSFTARSKPVTGTVPKLEIVFHRVQTTLAQYLSVSLSDSNFSPAGGGTVVTGSGTIGDGSVRALLFIDNGNVPFTTNVYYNGVGPFTTSPFNATATVPAGPASAPFAMTLVLNFKLGANSSTTGEFTARTTPQLGSIGDFVWQDNNGNGVQDPGEPGIDGVTVRLKDSGGNVLDTKVTATNGPLSGYYLFQNVPAGTYTVEVDPTTLPAGFAPTATGAGTPATDNNGSPATVVLPAGASDVTIDFGYVPPCTGVIGDFVWNDVNRNGIQEPGEAGIPGVRLFLRRGSDPVRQAMTNASGAYEFTGVCAGAYTVEVDATTLPPNFVATMPGAPGSTPANDSNGSPANVVQNSYNSVDRTIDFGYYSACSASIGDFLWHDANRNGIQDAGETGLNGITVQLRNNSGAVVASTTSAANNGSNGYYQFTGLCAGTYTVEYVVGTVPAGFQPTITGAGTAATDSNASPSTVVLATNSSSDQTVDFGFQVPCTGKIGDFVWEDLNRNGVQDNLEPGIAGVTVNLRKPSDNSLLATTTTNGSGLYEFAGRCAGDYKVEAVPPTGYALSPAGAGTASTDSNPNPAAVTLPADNAVDTTIDFGFYRGSIGDRVWHDVNFNGVQDAGEAGLTGWSVTIQGPNGYSANTSTGANGIYTFGGLLAGSYTVCVAPMSGYTQTYDLDGVGTPNCAVAVLAAGQVRTDVDFGYYVPLPVGEYFTGTQGGWGQEPSGRNVGALLQANFATLYPGGLTVGGRYTIRYTSAAAVRDYLPTGGTPGVLARNYSNPTANNEAGVFAGQVTALTLNVAFSNAGLLPRGLAALRITAGKPLAGYSVAQVLALANRVLGGDLAALPAGLTVSGLNLVVDALNNNFVDGNTNDGWLN